MTTLMDSPKALALLDSLWALDTHIAVVLRRLMPLLPDGAPPYAEIRDAATRFQEKPKNRMPNEAAPLAPIFGGADPVRARPVDSVHRVKPGTYPANQFTMIGRRL